MPLEMPEELEIPYFRHILSNGSTLKEILAAADSLKHIDQWSDKFVITGTLETVSVYGPSFKDREPNKLSKKQYRFATWIAENAKQPILSRKLRDKWVAFSGNEKHRKPSNWYSITKPLKDAGFLLNVEGRTANIVVQVSPDALNLLTQLMESDNVRTSREDK